MCFGCSKEQSHCDGSFAVLQLGCFTRAPHPALHVWRPAPFHNTLPGLENSTRPLVFTSVSGCRASEYILIFLLKIKFSPCMPINFVMQGKCLFSDISRPACPKINHVLYFIFPYGLRSCVFKLMLIGSATLCLHCSLKWEIPH